MMPDNLHDPYAGHGPGRYKGLDEPESLQEQAGYPMPGPDDDSRTFTEDDQGNWTEVPDPPEYSPPEDPEDDFPDDGFLFGGEEFDMSDPYDKEYDVP